MELFVLTVHQVHSFCSGPDQSGRIVTQGLVEVPLIIRLRGKLVTVGRAGALADLGSLNVLCPILSAFPHLTVSSALLAVLGWEHFGARLHELHIFDSLADTSV